MFSAFGVGFYQASNLLGHSRGPCSGVGLYLTFFGCLGVRIFSRVSF